MATQGALTWFDAALDKIAKGTIALNTDTFKAVLLASTQAIDKTFAGASTDCRYADLTAELATASGYTAGGVTLTTNALTRSGSSVKWTADAFNWTLSGTITFKYVAIYDDTAANKDLLCFCDMDTGGGSVSALAGALQFTPNISGLLGWSAP